MRDDCALLAESGGAPPLPGTQLLLSLPACVALRVLRLEAYPSRECGSPCFDTVLLKGLPCLEELELVHVGDLHLRGLPASLRRLRVEGCGFPDWALGDAGAMQPAALAIPQHCKRLEHVSITEYSEDCADDVPPSEWVLSSWAFRVLLPTMGRCRQLEVDAEVVLLAGELDMDAVVPPEPSCDALVLHGVATALAAAMGSGAPLRSLRVQPASLLVLPAGEYVKAASLCKGRAVAAAGLEVGKGGKWLEIRHCAE
eukprot:scaffold8.g1507.t1